jgi:hypothetical protein
MAKRNLFNPEVAQSTTDDLYNGTLIPRLTRPVKLDGADVIKRGTPLTSDDGEEFKVWEEGDPIIGILLYDVDTSEEYEAENAVLGITGEFNRNKIEEALDDELTPEAVMSAWGRQIHIEANKKYPPTPSFPLG